MTEYRYRNIEKVIRKENYFREKISFLNKGRSVGFGKMEN